MNSSVVPVAGTFGPEITSAGADEFAEQDPAFLKLLQDFDAQQESAEVRRARQKAEAEAAQAHRDKMKKMMELHARMAQLRAQLAAQPQNSTLSAQLSAVQTELFWLMAAV